MADRTVAVGLLAKMQGYIRPVRDGINVTKEFGGELDRMRRTAPGGFRDIGTAAAGLGIAMAGLVGWALKTSMAFDKQMSEVKAVTGATADELGQLREAALAAGKSTVFSATEAAKAQAELAKAGLTTAQILGGGLKGALSLAAAGSLDLAEAADIAAKTMNVFNLEASSVGHIADMLAGAANATATDVHEMGEALRMGGLAAHAAGMSMDDTVVVLGAFADSALVGSDAGTSLKTMLQMLAAPTAKSAGLMKELGIDVYDAGGNFVGASALAETLRTKLGGLTQEQRNAALATIFGADAMRAANILYGLGGEGLSKYTEKILAQADAAKTAAEKTDNLAGDVERLIGSLETLAIQSGEGANAGLRWLAQTLESLVGWFSDLPGPVQHWIVMLAGVSGASLLVVAGMLKVRGVVGDAMQALRDMGPAGDTAAKGISRVGRALGAVTVVGAGFLLAKELVEWLTENSAASAVEVDGLTASLETLAATGRVSGDLTKVVGENFSKLELITTGLRQATEPMREFDAAAANAMNSTQNLNAELRQSGQAVADADKAWSDFKAQIPEVDQALKGMVENGGATQAALAFGHIREQWEASGRPLSELTALLPNYVGAMDAAKTANSAVAQGFGDVAGNARTMAGGLQEAIDKGQTLMDVFNQLNGANLSLSDAQIKAEASLDGLAEALKESKGSLDINTDAGRKAQGALNDMARAAAEVAQKTYDQTFAVKGEAAAMDASKAAYNKYIGSLRAVMRDAGLSESAINGLLGQIAAMPAIKTTKVEVKIRVTVNDATGAALSAIENRLSRLQGQAARIGRFADTGIGAKGGASMQGGMQRAAGGPVNMGQTTQINEKGQEYLTASRHVYVNPHPAPVRVQMPDTTAARPAIDYDALSSAVAQALNGVAVVMDGQRVGIIQGRYADQLARGG
ncbi:MAG: phage tail tape measure protein [Actinomycetota bacterium]|nr:phage tail tape measure protein [Actinomycetota bacterium]